MRNKKILLALMLICTATPLSITNAMINDKNKNMINNNINISEEKTEINKIIEWAEKKQKIEKKIITKKRIEKMNKNNQKGTPNYDPNLSEKIKGLLEIEDSLNEIYKPVVLLQNKDTGYITEDEIKQMIGNTLYDIREKIKEVEKINQKNHNKYIKFYIKGLNTKLKKFHFLLIAKKIEILIEKAKKMANHISENNLGIENLFEEATKEILENYHISEKIYKSFVEKKHKYPNKVKILTKLVNYEKKKLDNKINEIKNLKHNILHKNTKTYKNNNISKKGIVEIINWAKNNKVEEEIATKDEYEKMFKYAMKCTQNECDYYLNEKFNIMLDLEKTFNKIYKPLILLQDENIDLNNLETMKEDIYKNLNETIFPKIKKIKNLNKDPYNQKIEFYINYIEIVAQKINALTLIREIEIDLKGLAQYVNQLKDKGSEYKNKYENELKKINEKIKILQKVNTEVYKENVNPIKEENAPTDLNKILTKLINYNGKKLNNEIINNKILNNNVINNINNNIKKDEKIINQINNKEMTGEITKDKIINKMEENNQEGTFNYDPSLCYKIKELEDEFINNNLDNNIKKDEKIINNKNINNNVDNYISYKKEVVDKIINQVNYEEEIITKDRIDEINKNNENNDPNLNYKIKELLEIEKACNNVYDLYDRIVEFTNEYTDINDLPYITDYMYELEKIIRNIKKVHRINNKCCDDKNINCYVNENINFYIKYFYMKVKRLNIFALIKQIEIHMTKAKEYANLILEGKFNKSLIREYYDEINIIKRKSNLLEKNNHIFYEKQIEYNGQVLRDAGLTILLSYKKKQLEDNLKKLKNLDEKIQQIKEYKLFINYITENNKNINDIINNKNLLEANILETIKLAEKDYNQKNCIFTDDEKIMIKDFAKYECRNTTSLDQRLDYLSQAEKFLMKAYYPIILLQDNRKTDANNIEEIEKILNTTIPQIFSDISVVELCLRDIKAKNYYNYSVIIQSQINRLEQKKEKIKALTYITKIKNLINAKNYYFKLIFDENTKSEQNKKIDKYENIVNEILISYDELNNFGNNLYEHSYENLGCGFLTEVPKLKILADLIRFQKPQIDNELKKNDYKADILL